MAFDTLFAAEPLAINKTYDKVWVEEVVISAPEPNSDASARVRLRLFRDTEGGRELSDKKHDIFVDGLLAKSAGDTELEQAVSSLMAYVAKVGREQGLVAGEV